MTPIMMGLSMNNPHGRVRLLGKTRWCREIQGGNHNILTPIDMQILLGFCAPDSSIVIVSPKSRRQVNALSDSLAFTSSPTRAQNLMPCFELESPSIDALICTLIRLTGEGEDGWTCIEHAHVSSKSICLVLQEHKRAPRHGMPKKVDDLVIELTEVWSPWVNPNDPQVLDRLSRGLCYLHLYGHTTPEIEVFNKGDGNRLTTRLFDLSLTHYVKNISFTAWGRSASLNIRPCSENGGQTNIDAEFIDALAKSIRETNDSP